MKVEVTSNVDACIQKLEDAMEKAATMIGGTIQGHAVELCPVDTGLLRNSITYALGGKAPAQASYHGNQRNKAGQAVAVQSGTYEGSAPPDEKGAVTVYVGTNVQYAPYQELGAPNRNINPQPYLRPACENSQLEIKQIIEMCLKDIT